MMSMTRDQLELRPVQARCVGLAGRTGEAKTEVATHSYTALTADLPEGQ